MKNKFAALIAATFVATPVMAQNVDNQVFANQNVKAIELSKTEMKETQGEAGYFGLAAALGGAHGAWAHQIKVNKGTDGVWGSSQSAATAAALGAGKGLALATGQFRFNKALNAASRLNTKLEIQRINNR